MCLLPSCLSHHREGQFQHAFPDAGRKNLPEEGDVLVGRALLAVILQAPPHFVETFTFFIVEAFGFFRDRQEPACQVDREELWVFSILSANRRPRLSRRRRVPIALTMSRAWQLAPRS
jgi:hypothetical protein